jgi:hypothetical protein
VVTLKGKPVATVTGVPEGADWESLAIAPNEMRRRLGVKPKRKAKRKAKP